MIEFDGRKLQPIKRVFCKNCKYLSAGGTICGRKYKHSRVEFDPVEGKITIHIPLEPMHPRSRNANFDCRYYKELWWKFWEE